MSAFTDRDECESVSAPLKSPVLRSNCGGDFPSPRNSEHKEESEVKQACDEHPYPASDASVRSALGGSSHEEDTEGKNHVALELGHHRVARAAQFSHRSHDGQVPGLGATSEDTPAPKTEHHQIGTGRKEPCPTSRCGSWPALARSTHAGCENPTDAAQSHEKKTSCAGGTCQSKSKSCLSPKQRCGTLASHVNPSRRRMHQAQEDSEDKSRSEASIGPDTRVQSKSSAFSRPLPAQSRATGGHQETPWGLRAAQISQMATTVEKVKNPAGQADRATNAPGPSSEKEGDGPKRSAQQSTSINAVRRPLIRKGGKRVPVPHSASSRSFVGSRRASLTNSTEVEKKHALSRSSTVDTEGTSTISQPVCKRNFIRENMQNACAQQHQRQAKPVKGKSDPSRRHSSFGKIPEYLTHIKSQLREEAKKARDKEAADKLPPGMRVMGNEERLETVRRLKKEQSEAEQELARMPIAIKTNAQRRRMEYLERRLAELDREQQKYSKPNILVGV